MADSIREIIVKSVAALMQNIKIVNGYDIDVNVIARAQRVFELNDLPAITIFDLPETTTSAYNINTQLMQVDVEMYGDAESIANRSPYANTLMASVKKAGLALPEHNGYATDTHLAGGNIRYPVDDDNTQLSIVVSFMIKYDEIYDDPYSKP